MKIIIKMAHRMKWLWISVLVFCLGCSGLARRSPYAQNSGRIGTGLEGMILRPDRLEEGGNVQILPFSPGIFLPASEKADRAALLITRGIMDGLAALNNGLFHVISAQEDEEPDLIITGRITRFDVHGGWRRFFGGQRFWIIELDGRVTDRKDEWIAVFSHMLKVPYKDMSETAFLLKTGQEIGEFLRGSSQ